MNNHGLRYILNLIAASLILPLMSLSASFPWPNGGIKMCDSDPGRDTLPPGWVDLHDIEPNIKEDIRYATTENFVGSIMYPCGRCILRQEVADALHSVYLSLRNQGYALKVFDCYRPLPVQQFLWNKVPDPRYVTPPEKGSMHNRGAAVDLTLLDANGEELDMGTTYDYFGPPAYHDYPEHPSQILQRRKLLKDEMIKAGFRSIRTEWWHYSYTLKSYELSNFVWSCGE